MLEVPSPKILPVNAYLSRIARALGCTRAAEEPESVPCVGRLAPACVPPATLDAGEGPDRVLCVEEPEFVGTMSWEPFDVLL